MLDPLTALNLASSVCQFIDFSLSLVKETNQIRSRASTVGVWQVKNTTLNLVRLNRTLKARPRPPSDKSGPLQDGENALDDLLKECSAVADELIACLDKLAVDHKGGRWKSFCSALNTVWSKDKIDELSTRLNSFWSELALCILVLVNAKIDSQAFRQAETFDQYDRSSHEVVEIMSLNSRALEHNLREHAERIKVIHQEGDVVAQQRHEEALDAILTLPERIKDIHGEDATISQQRHEETIAAILKLRDGDTQIISRLPIEDRSKGPGHYVGIQTSMTVKAETEPDALQSEPERLNVILNDFEPVQQKILDCLHYRQRTDRVEEVALAHRRTFQWIFRDPEPLRKPWSNFVKWLKQEKGCYWICGKAGSGKSTLMKYIQDHPKTRRALQLWAGDKELVTASFFFWNLGSALQKSHNGLLRSLLLDVLERHPYLIPSIFPELCRAALADTSARLCEPTFAELKKAFSNLLDLKSTSWKICFFLDGIDEYDGDHTQLFELLATMSSSSCVKIVLSSRPTPPCVEAFSKYDRLRLQDLTYHDIKLYAEDKLGRHPRMTNLQASEPAAATALITEISTKASGVFLWVMLVVKSLSDGLRNHDRISDLRRRLDELPADLQKLYEHMLQTMSPIYRQQASQFFQIMVLSTEIDSQQPLSLLQLSYADDEDVTSAVRMATGSLTKAAELARCEATEERLRSRCCGLIEVQEKRAKKVHGSSSLHKYVGFLHKTVVEFLLLDNNWRSLLSLTAKTSFDPRVALLSSCLSLLKVQSSSWTTMASNDLWLFCRSFLLYCMLAEQYTRKAQTRFLTEFSRTMTLSRQPSDTGDSKNAEFWTVYARFSESFTALAIRFGLVLFAEDKLDQDPTLAQGNSGSILLREAVNQVSLICSRRYSTIPDDADSKGDTLGLRGISARYNPEYEIQVRLYFEIIRTVLQHGADPNYVTYMFPTWGDGNLCSPWEQALDQAAVHSEQNEDFLSDLQSGSPSFYLAEILRLLVLHGADPNAVRRCGNRSRTAMEIVRDLLIPAPRVYQRLPVECRDAARTILDDIAALLVVCGAASTSPHKGAYATCFAERGIAGRRSSAVNRHKTIDAK